MLGLLYKELIIHKKQFFWAIPFILFFSLWTIIPPAVTPDLTDMELGLVLILCAIVVMITVGMFEQGLFEADERKVWQAYIISTPKGKYGQIGSKYLFNAILSSLVIGILCVLFLISGSINGTDVKVYMNLLVWFLSVQLMIRSLETPFIVRFGSKHGNMYRMVLLAIITMAVIVYGLFGDLSVFGSMEDFVFKFGDFIKDSSKYIQWIALVVCAVLYFISYLISCLLYIKGGEHYDK